MLATSRRNARPLLPREGRLPARSRPSARASAKSRSSITIAWASCSLAMAMRLLMAALSRPSRAVAGRPARSRPMVAGAPRMLPSGRDGGHGEVAVIDVDRHHRMLPQLIQGRRGRRGRLPRRVQVTAAGRRVMADVIADRAGGGLRSDLIAPVGEPHRTGQPVPAVRPVRETGERGRQPDLQPALVRVPADRLVPPRLARLAVRFTDRSFECPCRSPGPVSWAS